MSIIEQIITALLLSNPNDLGPIRQYIGWMKFRKHVNGHFYTTAAHWVQPSRKYHWVR